MAILTKFGLVCTHNEAGFIYIYIFIRFISIYKVYIYINIFIRFIYSIYIYKVYIYIYL